MKTNTGLVAHCKVARDQKWGYVWGTYGEVFTRAKFNTQKTRYPNEIGKHSAFIQNNWIGKRTADCSGLIKSYLWWNGGNIKYNGSQNCSDRTMYSQSKRNGPMSNMPELPGLCVWKSGHIGVYIGNGQVIEARNTTLGVQQTPLKNNNGSSKWTNWFEHKDISYSGGSAGPVAGSSGGSSSGTSSGSTTTWTKGGSDDEGEDDGTVKISGGTDGLNGYSLNREDSDIYVDATISSCSDGSSRAKIALAGDLIGEPIYPDLIKIDEFKTFDLLNVKIDDYLTYEDNMVGVVDKDRLEEELGVDIVKLFFPESDNNKYSKIDEKKLRSEKIEKKPNDGGPINAKDPFPVDNKIEELETHDPMVTIKDFEIPCVSNTAIQGDAVVGAYLVDLAARTEQRLARIENNLATVMRNTFALGSRVNINCVYYGGQCQGEKYDAIRCMNDDLINDGALVSIDRCLSCDRYEPVLGQVYDILEDGSANFNAITDDLQSAYMTSDDYLDLVSRQNMHNEQPIGDILKAEPKEIDFLKEKWKGKDFKMDWDYTVVEDQEVDVNWHKETKPLCKKLTKTTFNVANTGTGDEPSYESSSDLPGAVSGPLGNGKNPNFALPIRGGHHVTSEFGWRASFGRMHNGIDLAKPIAAQTYNWPIVSSTTGTVIFAGWWGSGGWTCMVQTGNYVVKYMHQPQVYVKVGQKVNQGDVIGRIGNSGGSTGAHLHFEINRGGMKGQAINPRQFVNF